MKHVKYTSKRKKLAQRRGCQLPETIFCSSTEGMIMTKNQGEIIRSSPAIEKMFGYNTDELVNLHITSLIPMYVTNSIGQRVRKPFQYGNNTGSPKGVGVCKDGHAFALQINTYAAVVNHENVVIFSINPMSEPHEMNKFESRQKHLLSIKKGAMAIEQKSEETTSLKTPEVVASLNRDSPGVVFRSKNDAVRTFLYVSDSIEQLTGYKPGAFYQPRHNFSFWELIHPDDRKYVQDKIQASLAQRSFYEVSYRIISQQKQEKWVWEQGNGIYSEAGGLLYLEGFLLDVTDKKKTIKKEEKPAITQRNYTEELEHKVKERTRELTAMVKKLVETNLSLEYQIQETRLADAQAKKNYALYVAIARYFPKVMIVVIDKDYKIVFLDGEERQKIGLDKENVEGLAVKNVKNFSAEWKKQMMQYAQCTFKGGHHSYEIKYRTNNYKINTMPLDDHLAMFIFTNITEQKRTERKMIRALNKERELSELKSRFVSMASHEFRTPLSTILSAANLIARQNEPGKEDKRLKNVDRIKSSVKNLIDILNEFLSIGRLEEGEMHMKKEVFDLMDFMKTIIQELQHVQKPGQQVQLTSDREVIQVNLDKQFTRNVFLNLLSNALKYSPHHKPVDLIITTEGSSLVVVIKDQGIGIPEDEQQNLFNLFFRARNVTNIEGTGLGLPIVKKYIELMHGKITFESKLEQGSTFTITLPLDQDNDEKNSINRG